MAGVGRALWGSPSPTPCPSRVAQSRLHSTAARRVPVRARHAAASQAMGSSYFPLMRFSLSWLLVNRKSLRKQCQHSPCSCAASKHARSPPVAARPVLCGRQEHTVPDCIQPHEPTWDHGHHHTRRHSVPQTATVREIPTDFVKSCCPSKWLLVLKVRQSKGGSPRHPLCPTRHFPILHRILPLQSSPGPAKAQVTSHPPCRQAGPALRRSALPFSAPLPTPSALAWQKDSTQYRQGLLLCSFSFSGPRNGPLGQPAGRRQTPCQRLTVSSRSPERSDADGRFPCSHYSAHLKPFLQLSRSHFHFRWNHLAPSPLLRAMKPETFFL